jgi:MFS family permease
LLGQLVPRSRLASAATWSSTNWQVGAVVGPAVGGLVYGFAGVVPAYSTVFIFYVTAFILIMKIRAPGRVLVPSENGESMFSRIREGIQFVFRNQVLLGAFSLDMFAVLFGGTVAILPVFASDILQTGPQGLGILRACPAIGAILMSIALTARPPLNQSGLKMMFGVGGFGICMILFAISTHFYFSCFVLLVSGAMDNISVVIRASVLQLFTPDEVKGRVAAVNSIFVGSSNELGAFESGVAARLMGLVPSVIFGGAMTLMAVGIAIKKAPRLRNLSLGKI